MSDAWSVTAARAAREARWLRPLAITLFVVALLMIFGDMLRIPAECTRQLAETGNGFSFWCQVEKWGRKLIHVGPAIVLAWALFEAQAYLKRLEDGAVWAPSTMKLFARIVECLIVAAIWSAVVAPTLQLWVGGQGGLDWEIDAQTLVLGGLGIVLEAIARVIGEMLGAAEGLKADSDAIV